MNINTRIKEIRDKYCNGSNSEFAKRLGKNPNTTSNWVRSGYSVGRGVASEISAVFNIDLNWLLTGVGEVPKALPKEDRKVSRGEHIKNVFYKSTDEEIEELIEAEFTKHLLEMYEAGRAYPAVYVKELREDLQVAQQQIIELKRQNEVLRSEIETTRK